jgi:thioredoxin 1
MEVSEMAAVMEVNSANFRREVLESDLPVMVDFWAEWCVPCRMIAPIVERLAERYAGRLKVAKLDVDRNQDLAIEYQVMSIPTLLFFKNGQVVDRLIGAVGEQVIVQKIEALLQGSGRVAGDEGRG